MRRVTSGDKSWYRKKQFGIMKIWYMEDFAAVQAFTYDEFVWEGDTAN